MRRRRKERELLTLASVAPRSRRRMHVEPERLAQLRTYRDTESREHRRNLLALHATHPNATMLRTHAAEDLNRQHGNRYVQLHLQELVRMPASEAVRTGRTSPLSPMIARQAAPSPPDANTVLLPVVSKTYRVTGKTLEQAFKSIEAYAKASQHGEAASVSWNPKWSYTKDSEGRIKTINVTVTITITMPHWPEASLLSKAAKAEWNRAYKELKAHEERHVAILKSKAKNVGKSALGKTEAEAQKALAKDVEKVNKANTAIDPFRTDIDTSIE